MKKRTPLVSIIMTAYNAAEFVSEAVASIQDQTYSHWELIVVNDGSTDKTAQILRTFAKQDKRIKLISYFKNQGASYASNLALARAKGSLLARMDADDIALPDRLSLQVAYLYAHPNVIAVGGQCDLIDRSGQLIGSKSFPQNHASIYQALYMYNPIQHPALMINRALLGSRPLTYHQDVLLAHDLEILFYLAQFGELANIAETVLQYRIHTDSLSLHDPKATFRHTLEVRKRAVMHYAYTRSFKASITDLLQRIVVGLLPNMVIYPLFRMLRLKRLQVVKQTVKNKVAYFSFLLVSLFSLR